MKNKILFFLLLLWFWFPASDVQAMEVITLKATPEDLSASISPVYDLNGKACALMKIVLPIDNAIFEGNVMGNVGYVNNEYWVYLTEGTRFLKIKTPRSGSLTIDFSSYGIHGLVSKQTYELSISVKDEIQEFQSLTIRYQPANAQLYLKLPNASNKNPALAYVEKANDKNKTVTIFLTIIFTLFIYV